MTTDTKKIKKISWIPIAVVSLVFSLTTLSWAGWRGSKAKAESKALKSAEIEAEKKQKFLKEAAEKLNNTAWQIQLTQITIANNKETFKDTVRFSDYKVKSDSLSSEGFFPASNYTLASPREAILIWETMQTSEKKDLAFWKGEIEGEVMRGVLSRHFNDKAKTIKEYTFVSFNKEIIPEAAKETPQETGSLKPGTGSAVRK